MDFMTIILAVVAVYVAKPAFTGKGKLMSIENVKEGKEKIAKKGLRISYLIMFFSSLLMILVSLIQNNGFKVNAYTLTFTDDFTSASGGHYKKGAVMTLTQEQLQALYELPESEKTAAQPTGAFSCATTANNYAKVPCTYVPVYELNKYSEKVPGDTVEAKYKFIRVCSFVLFAISLADIVFLIVFTNKMTDKTKKEKAQDVRAGNRAHMPSGAFDFDENEPVAPDDPKVMDAGK